MLEFTNCTGMPSKLRARTVSQMLQGNEKAKISKGSDSYDDEGEGEDADLIVERIVNEVFIVYYLGRVLMNF